MNGKRWFGAVAVAILAAGLSSAAFAQEPRPGRVAGLMVTRVTPRSTAAVQGLRPGDLILAVNGNRVRSMEDLHEGLVLAGWVAELDVADGATLRMEKVLVYPREGRIGVEARPIQPDAVGRVRPAPWEGPAAGSNTGSLVNR